MLVLLSPSKTQDFASTSPTERFTEPRFLPEATDLVAGLRQLTAETLATRLGTSDRIARATREAYQTWGSEGATRSRQAVFAYTGEVYRTFDARTLSSGDLAWAQRHVRILSALYGLLRPLDRIEPYRLDLTDAVRAGAAGSLAAFWRARIAEALCEELPRRGPRVLVNLASQEYARVVDAARLDATVVTPSFREPGPNGLRTVSVRAKHARGRMARWIVAWRIRDPGSIVDFDEDDYRYREDLSDGAHPVFVREATSAL